MKVKIVVTFYMLVKSYKRMHQALTTPHYPHLAHTHSIFASLLSLHLPFFYAAVVTLVVLVLAMLGASESALKA